MTLRALLVGTLAALAAQATPAIAAPVSRIAGGFGILPHSPSASQRLDPTIPVVYHGGPVMRGVTVHTVFWAPPGYRFTSAPTDGTLGYEALIQRFVSDVAADAGSQGNIFSLLREYSDAHGPGDPTIHYDAALDSVDATDPYPGQTSGCASPAGTPTCVTDTQVRAELDRVIRRSAPQATGLGQLWIVLLPPGVDECLTASSCATNAFAGYHSLSRGAGAPTVYSAIPDPSLELTPPPGSDPQGNPQAETAINTLAHEMVEAITDPTGVGWMDPNGFEAADKCQSGPQYGPPLGFAPDGSPYNQVIGGHEYLLQAMWSNVVSGCIQHPSGTAAAVVLPQVYLTQFSPDVSGVTGIRRKGVRVDAVLVRAGEPVAAAEGTTRADGSWGPISLSTLLSATPRAVGDDRDILLVDYGTGGPPAETIVTGNGGDPFTSAGWTGWYALDHGYRFTSNGLDGQVRISPCSQTGDIRVKFGAAAAVSATDDCAADTNQTVVGVHRPNLAATVLHIASNDNRAPYIDNRGGALVRLAIVAGEPNSVSELDNPLIPFPASGFPVCTADLQYGRVACTGLVPGASYVLARSRGGVAVRARADGGGAIHTRRLRGARPLRGGDVIRLRGAAGRVETTLHVGDLRVDLIGNQTIVSGGSCDPGLYYGPGLTTPPRSTAAVQLGVAGTGTICPGTASPQGFPVDDIEQTDDRSGGQTRTEVPLIEDTAPLQDETVPARFRMLVGAGFPGSHGSVVPSGARVAVSVVPVRGGRPVVRLRNVNTRSGALAGPLAPGVYRAIWVLHDLNGDTRTVRSRFIVGA